MNAYWLMGTDGCHLCEDAAQLLNQANIAFKHCEIMDNSDWQQRFGLVIPVLLHPASQQQLNWPFDSQQLQHFYHATTPAPCTDTAQTPQ
jgi:hypothetical protein